MNLNRTKIFCIYLDHSTHSMFELGSLHNFLLEREEFEEHEIFYLLTCQRFEVYFQNNIPSIAKMKGMIQISDPIEVRQRLAEIATGIHSQILGERFILQQVKEAAKKISTESELTSVINEAIKVAQRVRETHLFTATKDYPDVAYYLLPKGSDLTFIFGGGVLARSVAKLLISKGRVVVMVTRSPRKLRKRFGERDNNLNITSYSQLKNFVDAQAYNVILATNSFNQEILAQLKEILLLTNCIFTVDLCSVPISAYDIHPSNYQSMYDDKFLSIINEINKRAEKLVDIVRKDITTYYCNRYSHSSSLI